MLTRGPRGARRSQEGGALLKKGFLFGAKPARRTRQGRLRAQQQHRRRQQQAAAPVTPEPEPVRAPPARSPTTSTPPAPPPATKVSEGEGAEEGAEFDEDGLRTVWDSAPEAGRRKARAAWANLDHRAKLRWTQTSTDVHAFIKVPAGTAAGEVTVQVTATRLEVRLGWFGRVFAGPLQRRCKAGESWWLLEDDEIHVLLPKDDPHFWSALFEGGEKKGYHEILQELVQADEPAVAYDDLDERAKDLVNEVRERQQLIAEGLIDPDAFDDFRCVIGESTDAI